MTGLGHERQFPAPELSARYRFGQGTFLVQQKLFRAALDELAAVGEPINRVLEVDLDGEEVTLAFYDLPTTKTS
jgi:hypothetical protein